MGQYIRHFDGMEARIKKYLAIVPAWDTHGGFSRYRGGGASPPNISATKKSRTNCRKPTKTS